MADWASPPSGALCALALPNSDQPVFFATACSADAWLDGVEVIATDAGAIRLSLSRTSQAAISLKFPFPRKFLEVVSLAPGS